MFTLSVRAEAKKKTAIVIKPFHAISFSISPQIEQMFNRQPNDPSRASPVNCGRWLAALASKCSINFVCRRTLGLKLHGTNLCQIRERT